MSFPEFLSGLNGLFGTQIPMVVFSVLAAVIVILLFAMPLGGVCTYLERKVAADFQERIGPNRVGPIGLLQFFADGIKMFLKEDTAPRGADHFIYNLAPSLVLAGSMGAFALVPFGKYVIGADLDIGIFYVMALGSLVSLGILLGAWASDNKWSLIGGMRAAAQIVSYEIPLGLAVLSVVTVSGTMSMFGIVDGQAWPSDGSAGHFWNIFYNPFLFLNFFIYFISALAECNRVPFDLAEAESELVSGFNTEFSGMRFGLYALAEFADVILFACVASAIFLGGWHLPFINISNFDIGMKVGGMSLNPLIQTLLMLAVFLAKVSVLVFIVMWIRWTLPRLRVDQLMNLCWKYLIPIAFFNLVGSALWVWLFKGQGLLQIVGKLLGVYA
ncbi:MAG: NADH-quinone oxidoreductase subunit NuoH [Bdellovibrionales bacterium]|nr:NADH-quinone oxidoreductase subunit NuoH [Bdellovibrionales bacterium]